ncbi:MAG: wax ester/triacylglycerol synthase family O-acyltransferase [Candidatus Binatia bacterium]
MSDSQRHPNDAAPATGSGCERLSALDQMFLLTEGQNTHMHIAVTAVFDRGGLLGRDGRVDIERIRAYVASRLHWIPRYRQRLEHGPLGEPVWIDDASFTIAYHVRHTSLPRPGGARELKELAARIKSQRLDREKPLWELWIVEGLAEGGFAMVTKAHHCMIDGLSGADLLAVLLQPAPSEQAEPAPPFTPRPVPSRAALLGMELARRAGEPLALAAWALREPRQAAGALGERARAFAELLPNAWRRCSDTPLNGPIGPHRRFEWLAMDLADVKAVKDRLGGTVNDVVLATVAGALARFLARRGVDVSGLDFRAMVPVSVRGASERGTLGNRVAGWITQLPVGERSARRRLARVQELTRDHKDSKQALGVEALTQLTDWASSTVLSTAIQLAFRARPFNLVVTNVPGPQVPLYLLDAPMRAVYPQVPLFPDQGLGVALFSYDGHLYWGFNADYDLVPDLVQFRDDIAAAFAELQRAAGVRGAAALAPVRRPPRPAQRRAA